MLLAPQATLLRHIRMQQQCQQQVHLLGRQLWGGAQQRQEQEQEQELGRGQGLTSRQYSSPTPRWQRGECQQHRPESSSSSSSRTCTPQRPALSTAWALGCDHQPRRHHQPSSPPRGVLRSPALAAAAGRGQQEQAGRRERWVQWRGQEPLAAPWLW